MKFEESTKDNINYYKAILGTSSFYFLIEQHKIIYTVYLCQGINNIDNSPIHKKSLYKSVSFLKIKEFCNEYATANFQEFLVI